MRNFGHSGAANGRIGSNGIYESRDRHVRYCGVFTDRLPLCSRILVQTDHYLRKEITRYRLPPGVGLKIIGTFVTGDR